MLKAWRTWAFIVEGRGVMDIVEAVGFRTSWDGRIFASLGWKRRNESSREYCAQSFAVLLYQ